METARRLGPTKQSVETAQSDSGRRPSQTEFTKQSLDAENAICTDRNAEEEWEIGGVYFETFVYYWCILMYHTQAHECIQALLGTFMNMDMNYELCVL